MVDGCYRAATDHFCMFPLPPLPVRVLFISIHCLFAGRWCLCAVRSIGWARWRLDLIIS